MAEAVRAKPKKPKVKSKTKSKTESDDTGLSSPPPLPLTLEEIKSFRGETLEDRVYKTETVEEKAGQVESLEDRVYKTETVEEKVGQGVLDDRIYKTERLQEKEGQSDERDRVKAQQEAFNTRTQDTKKEERHETFDTKTDREATRRDVETETFSCETQETKKEERHEAFNTKTNREATRRDVETETFSCETQKEVKNETFSSETHGEKTQKDVKNGASSSESIVDQNVGSESDILLKEVLQPRTSDSTKQENLEHPGPIQEERETTHTDLLLEERERTHAHQVVGRERTHADFVQEQREGTLAGHVQEQREVTLAQSEMATPSLPLPQNKTELEVRTESHLYPDLPELDTGEDNDPIPVMVRKPEKSDDIEQASNSGCLDTESETQGSHLIPQSTLDDGSIVRDETMTTMKEGATVPVTPEEVTKEAQLLLPSLVSHDSVSPYMDVESQSHDTVSPNMGLDSQSHDATSPNMDIKSDTTQTVSPNIDVKSYNVNHGQEELRDLSTEATNTAAPNMGKKSKNQGHKELTDLSTESTSSNQFVFIQGEESESREETRPKEFSQGASIDEEFAFPSFVELERMRGEREVEGTNFKPMREERRGHLVREVGGANFKPMTFEQLQFLYYNPQLVQSTAFIDQFIKSEVKKESHEFHEILMNYYRACRNLLNAEGKVKLLQSEYNQLQDDMWIVTTYSIIAQGLCGDKAKVSTVHSYEQCQLSKDALTNMTSTLQTIRDGIVDNISLFAYSAQLSRLQVESYLNNLFASCPALREIPKNTPVQAFSHQQLDRIHQVARLKECISVLFTFHRRPSNDQEFTHNIRKWTEILVGCLMRVATFEDHCFILNHVLRCPGGSGKWVGKLIQIPAPSTPAGRTFGGPVLDHVVVCLATVLLPPKGREEFMCHMRMSISPESLEQDATWILVDSDGEEDEDPANSWLYQHENDVVAILKQFPISAVFAHILMARTDHAGSVFYDINRTTEEVMMKIFAFSTCWVDLLGRGLQTFSMARYRQLNKRLGKMIRETVQLVSSHWENYKSYQLQPDVAISKLQLEFDHFFMRATYCILTAQKLGSWQFMANMPFTCVSSHSMWQLLWILHQGQGQELDLDSIPPVDVCKKYLKDPTSRSQLVDNLLTLQSSETIYLLTTFANMAECRPTTEVEFIEGITLEVFEIAYVCDHTREFCSKVGRELLSSIVDKHSYTFSVLLHSVKQHMKQIGSMGMYLFRELPVHKSRPSDPDLLVIRQWLLQHDLHTVENQLACHLLLHFNWDVSQQDGMILPLSVHRQVALLLFEAYRKYTNNRNYGWLIGEGIRQVASVMRQNLTNEQQFNNWTWDLALHLKLHFHSITVENPRLAADFQPCDLEADDWLLPIVKGISEKNPLACYLGLIMSNRTHSVTEFVGKGLDILVCLASAYQYTAVIHVLSCVCPYYLSSPSYITDNSKFIKILQSTVWADETLYKMAKSVIVSDFPGPVTSQLIHMIQNDVSKTRETYQSQLTILFWLRAITRINRWYGDRNCCYIVNKLVELAFTFEGLMSQVETIFKDCFKTLIKETSQQGVVSSVVNWIASGIYLPSFLDKSSTPEFIWLAYVVLLVERNFEMESKLWQTVQEELHGNQSLTVDQALRMTVDKLKLSHAPVLHRLNIYRWALQAMATPYHHPLLPLLWQQFFLLFLGRRVSEVSVPHRASIGERFFSSLGHSSMLKMMKKNLSDNSEKLLKDVQDLTNQMTEDQSLYSTNQNKVESKQRLLRLYQTMVLWLEEPRLHDANLYLPSLPPQYDANKLLLLFQNVQNPWFEFVDMEGLKTEILELGSDWKKMTSSCKPRSPTVNQHQPRTATEKIVDFLRKENSAEAAPNLVTIRPPVPDISLSLVKDKPALLHLINADTETIKQYAGVFTDRIDRHCAADIGYIDLLPSLYSNQWKQVTITVECKSKVNPLHRCSNPAVVNLRIEEREKSEVIQRQIDENRAEYKQMMIEGVLPPPQNVCIAAVHAENAITLLIKCCQTSNEEETRRHYFNIASSLFYHLATSITEETDFYPPSKQFFTSCIEVLGLEFISRDPDQTQTLLKFCLDNPSLSGLMSPYFKPNNNPESFVKLYEQLIAGLNKQDLDLVFMLLTKFDVWLWLEKGRASREDIKTFINILGTGLMSLGPDAEKKAKTILDLYCTHLQLVLQYNYPSHITEVLSLLLRASSVKRLHVEIWQMYLMTCFTYIPISTVEGGQTSTVVFTLDQVEACTDIKLGLAEVNEILGWVGNYFMQARSQSNSGVLFGLYPTWGQYVSYLSHLQAVLIRCLVTKMVFNMNDVNPYQVLDVIWQQTTQVFSPWIEPVYHGNQLISPWHQGDDLVAMEVVVMFTKTVEFIYHQFAEKAPAYSSSVYSLMLMYFIKCLAKRGVMPHVVSSLVSQLEPLPWKSLKPDLHLIEAMLRVKEDSGDTCFHLVGCILSQTEWSDIWEHHIVHQPPDVSSRFQAAVLTLLVQIYTTPSLIQRPETVQLLIDMEQREWTFLTLSSYRNVSNLFLMAAEPRVVLAERSNPAYRGLSLMKKAGCFTTQSASSSWSGDLQAKRQMFVQTVVSLLCQCTYIDEVDPDTFTTVIVNLLTEMESVESADWRNPEEEPIELMKTFLSLLNNCNPKAPWSEAILSTICQWLSSSSQSPLLIPCLKSTSRSLACSSHIVVIAEACIDSIFTCESNSKDWTPVLAALQLPDSGHERFTKEAVSEGSYLVLQAYLLQQVPFCQSLADEFRLIELTVEWTEKAKPGSENESKLLLWWWKMYQLMEYYILREGSVTECIKLLHRLVSVLQTLGEDRTTAGLLGAIGLGRKSQLSLRFRITARALAAFTSAQILSPSSLRLHPSQPSATTPQSAHALAALQSLGVSKQYSVYRDQCQTLLAFIQDNRNCFKQASSLLHQLVALFYQDKLYLKVLTAQDN